jgi:phosphodiesterase/alkaline phosphatase D-like protein
VYNDFAGETVDRARFEAGRQAFQEYMPLLPEDPSIMYNSFRWGADLEIIVLDTRSFRSASAAEECAVDGNPDPLPAGARPDAPESLRGIRAVAQLAAELRQVCYETIDDPARTMLGAEQKAYLLDRLKSSDATWKVVVNSVPMQPLLFLPFDRWEGYAAERAEILEFIRDEGVANVVFLTTDFHANIFGPVRVDPFADTEQIAYEAIAGPIATSPLRTDIVQAVGEGAAALFGTFLTSIVGVDCAELDAYAYALVEVDPEAGTMTITAKDQDGAVLCAKELKAA